MLLKEEENNARPHGCDLKTLQEMPGSPSMILYMNAEDTGILK